MYERTKRISLRISHVLSKVEPETGAGPSHRLRNTGPTGPTGPTGLTSKVSKVVKYFTF